MRQAPILVPVEKTAYVGFNPESKEWILFRSWRHAIDAPGVTYLMPARPSDTYFASLAGKVVPKDVERVERRRRDE